MMGTLGGTGFGFNPLGAAGPGGSMYGGGFRGGFQPARPRPPMFGGGFGGGFGGFPGGGFGGGFGMPQQNFPGMGGGMQMPGMGGPAFPQQQFNFPQPPMFGGGFGGFGGGYGPQPRPMPRPDIQMRQLEGRPEPKFQVMPGMFGGGPPQMPGMFGGRFQTQGPQRLRAQQQAAGGMFGGRSPRMPSAGQLQQMMGGIFGRF
jgi:hypothetical protein